MPNERAPDLSLFLDILHTLEAIDAPYMVIGAFAATVYGITRVTYDIDIVVDLDEEHITALAAAYPLPRYYADPVQMRDSVRMGLMFNIIDTDRGEKADLVPLTMASPYRQAFQRRVRQTVEIPGRESFAIWCARPEDVVVGKLLAWAEGRSRKHETDIYEMLVYHYLEVDPEQRAAFDVAHVDAQARALGPEVVALWETIKNAARSEAEQSERA
ncbi:MAG: nucleotidyl transferase AbiEii/AbiGii toxin family protein [Chloroflexi bacterium]|nr:nucleotidyl transferase AbiEii/AbiGii toxin family protein [Chloroflexota bacterium]